MKKILLIALLLGTTSLFAQKQQDSILIKDIPTIKNKILQQRNEIDALTKKLNNQSYTIGKQSQTISALEDYNRNLNASIDRLSQLIQMNSQNIVSNSEKLDTKIEETGRKADTQITQLDNSIEKNRLYWIIATLATFLLGGGLIYWLLSKLIQSNRAEVETQIKSNAEIEEGRVKLVDQLMEGLETQLKLQREENKSIPSISKEKTDHSLALKVADEIIRIQKNLSRMDESTRGLKQLSSSVQRIQDNFAANGYELVEMLGKDYNEGMKVTANFVPNDSIESGKEIITRIIKPQVNYKGEMIQSAQIEVSIGE